MARVTGRPSRRVGEARAVGFRGGQIAPHRAMIGIEISWTLAIDLLVLPSIFAVAMLLLLEPITDGWRLFFDAIRLPLELPGFVGTRVFETGPLAVAVPLFNATSRWPTALDLASGWGFAAAALVLSLPLKGRLLPVAYLLRALAAVQVVAQLWFTVAAPPFAYTLPAYVSGLLLYGVVILVLSPFLVAFTFNIFDFRLWQKLLMGLLLQAHLTVLIPLLAVLHTWIIVRASVLAMPMLFFAFGVLFVLFVYVSLYGWGMSWRSGGVLDAAVRRPPPPVPRYPVGRLRPTPTPASVRAITPVGVRMVQAVRAGGALMRLLTLRGGWRP